MVTKNTSATYTIGPPDLTYSGFQQRKERARMLGGTAAHIIFESQPGQEMVANIRAPNNRERVQCER